MFMAPSTAFVLIILCVASSFSDSEEYSCRSKHNDLSDWQAQCHLVGLEDDAICAKRLQIKDLSCAKKTSATLCKVATEEHAATCGDGAAHFAWRPQEPLVEGLGTAARDFAANGIDLSTVLLSTNLATSRRRRSRKRKTGKPLVTGLVNTIVKTTVKPRAACKPVGQLDCDRFPACDPKLPGHQCHPQNCPDDLSKLEFWTAQSLGGERPERGQCKSLTGNILTSKTYFVEKGDAGNAGGKWLSGFVTDADQMYDSMLTKVQVWHPDGTPQNVGAIAIKRIVCTGTECYVYKVAHCIVCPKLTTPQGGGNKWNYLAPSAVEQERYPGKREKRTSTYIGKQKGVMEMGTEEDNTKYIPYPFESAYPSHISLTERMNFGRCLEYLNRDGKLFVSEDGENVVAKEHSCPRVKKGPQGRVMFDENLDGEMKPLGSRKGAWWATQRDLMGV